RDGRPRRLLVWGRSLAQCDADRQVVRRPLLVRAARLICVVPLADPRPALVRRLASSFWEKTTAVAVKIKLKRLGKIREPYYRIVVADARTKRDGRAIEEIGKYHPKAEPSFIEVDSERVQHWLKVGAQPTDPVRAILKITGDWQKFNGEPGAEGTLRTAEPRADKKEAFAAAAKESKSGSRSAKSAKDSAGKDTAAKDGAAKDAAAKDTRSARGKAASSQSGPAKTADAKTADAATAATAATPEGAEGATAEAKTDTEAPEAPAAAAESTADPSAEAASAEAAGAEEVKAADAESGSGA